MSTLNVHESARVHPSCVIEGEVTIGARSIVDAFTYLKGPIVIGEDSHVYPHCVIGTEGEHKTRGPTGTIRIGNRAIVRELCVIQRGTGDRETTIEDDCFVMDHAHVAHDVVLGAGTTVSPNVTFGGHLRVGEGANIGMGVLTHQFSTIGAYAMIGMGAVVTKDVPPFALVMGNPATFSRWNTHGLKRVGRDESAVRIENGELLTNDEVVKKYLQAFLTDRRGDHRKLMPLIPSARE